MISVRTLEGWRRRPVMVETPMRIFHGQIVGVFEHEITMDVGERRCVVAIDKIASIAEATQPVGL